VACQGEGDEVVLRRTFGATKDQYFLNKKPINKVRRPLRCGSAACDMMLHVP
jgi:hypothetical protein